MKGESISPYLYFEESQERENLHYTVLSVKGKIHIIMYFQENQDRETLHYTILAKMGTSTKLYIT